MYGFMIDFLSTNELQTPVQDMLAFFSNVCKISTILLAQIPWMFICIDSLWNRKQKQCYQTFFGIFFSE